MVIRIKIAKSESTPAANLSKTLQAIKKLSFEYEYMMELDRNVVKVEIEDDIASDFLYSLDALKLQYEEPEGYIEENPCKMSQYKHRRKANVKTVKYMGSKKLPIR